MTKRIVSGIFVLTALGALGVILAGALTSGEQLIVRFLTAVIVAALGLYVISDLRMQAGDSDMRLHAGDSNMRPQAGEKAGDKARGARSLTTTRLASVQAPPNSTAAFMASVTRRGESPGGISGGMDNQDDPAEDDRIEPPEEGVGATSSSTSEQHESAVVEDAGSPAGPPVPSPLAPAPATVRAAELPALNGLRPATITDLFARRSSDRPSDDQGLPPAQPPSQSEPASTEGADSPGQPGHPDTDDDLSLNGHPATGDERDAGSLLDSGGNLLESNDHVDSGDLLDSGDELAPMEAIEDSGERPVEATTEFEYSGEVDDPDYQWPAVPDLPTAGEAAEGIEIGVEVEAESEAEAGVQVGPAIELEVGAGVEAELGVDADADADADADHGDEPVVAADGTGTNGANGTHRPLPSPFLDRSSLSAAEYADAPLAPIIDLRDVATTTGSSIGTAIRSGELEVISALIDQGMLSTSGPISDRDVRTMVYVAFTSNELRKLLLAGGRPDRPNPGIDLGPVELFPQGIETPKTHYTPPPLAAEARSQLG